MVEYHRAKSSSKARMDQYPVVLAPLEREAHAPYRQMRNQTGHRLYHYLYCTRTTTNVLSPSRVARKKKKKDKEVINPEELVSVSDQSYVYHNVLDWDTTNVRNNKGKEVIHPQELVSVSDQSYVYHNVLVSHTDNNVLFIRSEELDWDTTNKGKEDIHPQEVVSNQSYVYDNMDATILEDSNQNVLLSHTHNNVLFIPSGDLDQNIQGNSETAYPMYNQEILQNQMNSLSLIHKDASDAVIQHQNTDMDEPQEAFIPLTTKEKNDVSSALSRANRRRLLVTHRNSNIEITGEILRCLKPGAWLNDEIINVYMELLKEREIRDPEKFLQCHFFNTFFYKKLISGADGYDFKSVRRWTSRKKLRYNLVDCDKIFIPVHKEMHWCLAVINKKEMKFQYLDSLRGTDSKVLGNLVRYLVDEVKDKSGEDIDVSSWKQEFVADLPTQQNGWDCGMFMIKYVDFYSRGGVLNFNQRNMKYFRLRTAKEILGLKAY